MHELFPKVIFYGFAGLTILSALMVITQSNPVRSVLFLVFSFFTSAVLWILLNAEFLALILVLVYVGAVMTLFLFVVMMLNMDVVSKRTHILRYLPFGLIIVALLIGFLLIALPQNVFNSAVEQTLVPSIHIPGMHEVVDSTKPLSNTEQIGMVLYTNYLLAFEIAAALLLVAIIAAITLVHREAIRSKRQNIKEQIMTNPNDRLKLITMKAERGQ